jgi:hypothetical protein
MIDFALTRTARLVALTTCLKNPIHCSSRRKEAQISWLFDLDQSLLTWAATFSKYALAALILWFAAAPAPAASEIEAARVKEFASLLSPKPAAFGRPITDRAAWDKLAQLPAFRLTVSNAQTLARQAVSALTDELYLDFSRTGNRDRCQKVLGVRDGRIATLALAECLENRGRFVGPLAETIDAICKERTWVLPAHDRKLDNFNGRAKEMDLRATTIAWELATADYLLGDKLPPATRRLIRDQVKGRVLQPFRDMIEGRCPQIYWLRATHNWNAVCLAGITGAALALEDSAEERAWYVAGAEHYIRNFLSGFTPDGYCSEGMGYWNYGFGRFIMLSEAIRQATGNKVDLLADPAALQPALYSTRSEILNGIYPTISDCHPGSRPDPQLVRFICERLGMNLPAGCNVEFQKPSGGLVPTVMFSFLNPPLPVASRPAIASDSPLRTWFKDGGVLICRPAAGSPIRFAAALKGGHNAEHHNHNDVGSFSVVAGGAMVICDPGAEVYTVRTFSAHRYDSKVLSSYGHAVPVVAGQLQQEGAQARAVALRTDFHDDEDTLALDIRSAYNVPELKKLERTFVFHRSGQAALTVRDEVGFSAPKSFETVLITWGGWEKLSEKELLITDDKSAVRVQIDTGGQPFKLTSERLEEDVATRTKPGRLGIALEAPVKEAVVTLTIVPVDAKTLKR